MTAAAVLTVPFAAGASADEHSASDGTLTWGIKESFRNYVSSPIANGSIETSDGATQNDASEFDFSSGTGTVDDDGTADVSFSGAVTFTGHDGALDVTLGSPSLTLDTDGTGELTVQHTPSDSDTPETVVIADVSGAELEVSGGTATLEGAQTALTEEGVDVFSYNGSGFYEAGEALDPVSATITVGDADPTDPAPTDPEPTDPEPTDPEPTDPSTDDPGTDDPAAGPVVETDVL